MRRSDQIDSTHVVLIPEVKIPLNLVVAAMSDGSRFLSIGGRRSQSERQLEPFGGHVRRGEGHPLAGRRVLALLAVAQRAAVKARHFSFDLGCDGLESPQKPETHPGLFRPGCRIGGRSRGRRRKLVRPGDVGNSPVFGHLDAVGEENRQNAGNLRRNIAVCECGIVCSSPGAGNG
nr:MAG TPA: hypothetical protein [Caudoviricetes sp.]